MVKRSVEMVIGLMGILKSGGTYLPVDPQYPESRIATMLEQSGAFILLTTGQIMESKVIPALAQDSGAQVIPIDQPGSEMEKQPAGDLPPLNGPRDLIYIIFTSGSTGKPKGVGVKHQGFMNLMHWFVTEFGLLTSDRNLLLTSLSFDLTQKNFYAPLITGGTLCIPALNYFEPRALLWQIHEQRITWLNCTPSMFYEMVKNELEGKEKRMFSLRYVFLGGEPISITTLLPWLESEVCGAEIVNTYGPTECTDICASYRIKEPRRFLEETIPVGEPVYNVQLYVLDKNLQLLPVGVPGEMLIGGDGVGIGYVNDKALTTQKFVTLSIVPGQSGQLLYRTGDLVKRLTDGNIEFLGRIDHQVKIRGYRIELGEIESWLLKHQSVREAVVLVKGEENGDKYICAYLVPGEAFSFDEIKQYLLKNLPDYMIPSYFVSLDKIPLSPNGKVDRKVLPEPGSQMGTDLYTAPRNMIEILLVQIWSEALGIENKKISIDANFFAIGGHSLKATVMAAKVHKELKVDLPLAEIFKTPTIRGLAECIAGLSEYEYVSIEPAEKREYYPLSSAQKRLYFLQEMDDQGTAYNLPNPVILEGELDKNRLENTFKRLIERHESLRTSFQMVEEEPVQRIHTNVEFKMEYYEMKEVKVEEERSPVLEGTRGLAPLSIEPAADLIKTYIRPFDLTQAPLLLVGLIKERENRHILMVDLHHIISDGVSGGLLVSEFMALYSGEALPELRLQYKDFSRWQNNKRVRESIKQQEVYWVKEFEEQIPVLHLLTDFTRPMVQRFEGNALGFEIDKETTGALKTYALEEGTTLFTVLLAVYNIFISKLSSQEDIVVGTPIAGRRHTDLERIMGMFVNTLALRNFPGGEKNVAQFLDEVKGRTLQAFSNQDYPYEELVESVSVVRDISRNPLFDTMFILQNVDVPVMEIPGLNLKSFTYDQGTSRFDLTLQVIDMEEMLSCNFEYSTKLFKAVTIEKFINYFKKILSAVLESPASTREKTNIG
jgi:amino acid adenylation domain-containing protein